MKFLNYNLLIVFVFLCMVLPAFSQDDIIVIHNEEFGTHKRPYVEFPHTDHEDLIECSRCHHDFDKFGTNTGGDGESCSECHSRTEDENPIPLMKAYHRQCKGCHIKISKNFGKENKPQMCGQCHVRKRK